MNLYDEDDFFTAEEKQTENRPSAKERQKENRKRKKKSKKKGRGGYIFVIILLLLLTGALGTKVYFQWRTLDKVAGEYREEIDITNMVALEAEKWLEDIEGVEVTTADVASYMGELKVNVITKCELDIYDNLTVTRSIDKYSYELCREHAYQGLGECFKSLFAQRAYAAGYDIEETDIDELVQKTIGMSLSEYIEQNAPEIMPEFDALTNEFATVDMEEIEQ